MYLLRGVITMGICLVAVALAFARQDPGDPVPQEWLSGRTLVVADFNFSVVAPAGWRWRQQPLPDVQGAKATAFLTLAPQGEVRYAVMVWQRDSEALSQADAERFTAGMAKSLPAGWTVGATQFTKSDRPIVGSAQSRTKLRAPDGSDYYQHAYIIPGRWSYFLLAYVPDEVEPQGFTDFATSFKLLEPAANRRVPSAVPGLLLILAVVGAIVDRRYIKAGGVRSTRKQKIYFGIAIGFCFAMLVTLGLLGGSAEGLGAATGVLLPILFALWEFGRFRTRRANPIRPKATTS